MKKAAKIIVSMFIALLLLFSFTTSTKADAGWDADYDYDYGGGWDSDYDYGGGWDHDYDYDHDYGGGHSSSVSSSENPTMVIIIFVIILFLILSELSKKRSHVITPINTGSDIALSVEEIKKVIPDFDYNKFKEQVFEIYKQIQIAWMNFDYDTLRKYTTDELYNTYHSQLIALNLKKQKNIMSDFEMISFRITNIEHNEKSVSLKVRTSIRCYDYVVNEKNNVTRGSKYTKLLYDYEMTFIKGLDKKENKCPNCNAPLENTHSSVCPYCNSTIVSDNHDWILSKKQMIQQKK